ncbi:MAG: ABC transporter permease [Erysipelotrichaceae bacterium]|nr:ABC transporter permease [Erysipelotrichaceae bacterium]
MKKINFDEVFKKYMAWIILLVVLILFSFTKNFLSFANIVNILSQNSYAIICSLGVAFLMMAGEIDLSVGYIMSLCSVIAGILNVQMGIPAVPTILITIVIGMILSMLNNFLSELLKINRFMITVATMSVFQGLSYVISKSVSIRGFSDGFKAIGQANIGKIPLPVFIMFFLLIVCSILMSKTYFGQYVYALGGNSEAANLAGINVKKMRYIISALAGALIAISAIILTARLGSAHSNTGPGTEFTAITGILLGGISVRGGEGKMTSVFAGVLIISILTNGMQLAGLDTYYQFIAKGIIMLMAIGIDVYNLNRRQVVRKSAK